MATCRRPIDRRKTNSRHYEKIKAELLRDLADGGGDIEELKAADVAMVEQAALLLTRAAMVRADILNGNAVSDETLVRISNAAARVLNALRGKRRSGKRVASLDEYLAGGDRDQEAA